jgi:hypothetical protein
MLIESFLTEYDETINSELNIDPLGVLIIWSTFGQQVFRSRVSSISNDVRNYTINLFNHWLIYELTKDDSVELGKTLNKRYADKQDLNFKNACLLYLENIFAYSMVKHESEPNINSTGVLGISKARNQWNLQNKSPVLRFGHDRSAHLLENQLSLGVSGRYKTPLIEMGFFDRTYNYHIPEAIPLWEKTHQLITNTSALEKVAKVLKGHLRTLLKQDGEISHSFGDVPTSLTKTLVDAFRSPVAVGAYARDFWLNVSSLNQGAPGALYKTLLRSDASGALSSANTANLFAQALLEELPLSEKLKLEHIRLIEPLLAELSLLFTLMLSTPLQLLSDIDNQWKTMGRNASTLAEFAKPIVDNEAMFNVLSPTARARLNSLLELACVTSVPEQIRKLLTYHEKVMERRGQSPWLMLRKGTVLKLNVRPRHVPSRKERPIGSWYHEYYIPQFRNLINGLQGGVA